jgi:hypothetical protein
MPFTELRRGDLVEVRSPADILATLDARGDLEGLPFMPEMAAYCGRRFTVERRADKICDTVQFSGSRRLPRAVLLEDLRCDGGGHDGCQANCRFFWKEEWLEQVAPDAPRSSAFPEQDREALVGRTSRHTRSLVKVNGAAEVRYRCQATEIPKYSVHLRTYDPRPYVRELTSGNVPLGRFIRVMGRAALEEPQRKLGLLPEVYLAGTATKLDVVETLNLRPGDWVRVKSKEEIAKTLDATGKTRGLRFDREMLPFCGQVLRVLRRVEQFIDEPKGVMVVMKTEAFLLQGAFCAGELNPTRWFCPRGIYAFWRGCWLDRLDPPAVSAKEQVDEKPAGRHETARAVAKAPASPGAVSSLPP